MSILETNEYGIFLDHSEYLMNIYSNVQTDKECLQSYIFCKMIFNIQKFIRADKKSNKRKKKDIDDEAFKVRDKFTKFMLKLHKRVIASIDSGANLDLKALSRKILDVTNHKYVNAVGGNLSQFSIKCKINGDYFLLPPKSRFHCGCVKEHLAKLTGETFNLLIADPPWWNKYIRKLNTYDKDLGYQMMYNEDLAALPIKELISPNCLVAVWCTNSPSNIIALKEKIFPSWNVQYVTTWYWVKVDLKLEPICNFNGSNKKQPFERLVLGKTGDLKCMPENENVFVSIPSAIHSHKPPLLDLLKPFIPGDEIKALELFARYMLPNTTSVGFEPLKFQHMCLFSQV